MKRLVAILALTLAARAFAQTAADDIAAGRTALAAHDLSTAQTDFQQALSLDPTNQTAAALLGATQLLNVASQVSTQTLLTDAGVAATGRDLYDWTAKGSKDGNGNPTFPANLNTSELFGYWHGTLVPACETARGNLALVTDSSFLLTLSAAETDSPASVTIDYGDVLASRAALRGLEFALHFLQGHNLNVYPQAVIDLAGGNLLSLQTLLTTYPDLLTTGTPGERAAARAALEDFIQLYRQASVVIRGRTAGVQRLFMLDPGRLAEEADFRATLDKVEASLSGFVEINPQAPLMFTAPLFSDSFSLRSLLPPITNGEFDPFAVPDSTMGGIFSGFSREFIVKGMSGLATPNLGWQWLNPTPLGVTYTGYAYGNGIHVALGGNGHLRTSTDGVNWTVSRISGKPFLNSVIFANGLFVAIGSGVTYSSTDGLAWQPGNGIDSTNYLGLTHAGGRFVAIGTNGGIASSTDGATWSTGNVGFPETYRSIVAASGRLVAVGGNRVITSTDGVQWASAATVTGTLSAVATDGSKFVAVGSPNLLLTSNDGLVWASGAVLAGANPTPSFSGIAFRNGLFVAAGAKQVANSSTCVLASSGDGAAWSALTTSQAGSLNLVAAGPDGFYALGSSGLLLRSTDGVTFAIPSGYAYQNVAPGFGAFNGFLSFGVGLEAFGAGGMMVASTDGTTFTPVSTGLTSNLMAGLVQSGTAYVVGSGGTIVTSTDGAAWSVVTSNTTANLNGITYGNGLYVAVGANGTVVTSPNGSTWSQKSGAITSMTIPTAGTVTGAVTLYDVTCGNGRYVAVGGFTGSGTWSGWNFPVSLVSADGDTWSPWPFTYTWSTLLRGVVFRDGQFTAVGTNGGILRSTDGINWSPASDARGLANDLLSIRALDDGRYWATVASTSTAGQTLPPSQVCISSDGNEWFTCPLPTSANLFQAVMFRNHVYVAGGGTVLLRTGSAIPAVSAPTVFKAPATSAAGEGTAVTLAAGVSGEGVLTYQWQKNGVAISGVTGRTFTIDSAVPGDAGSYTVVVTNSAGSMTSGAGVLTVTRDDTIFLQRLFQDVLGRPADQGALASFGAALAGGITRAAVLGDLYASVEYNNRQVEPAIRLYYAALARLPDYGGLQNWSNNLHAGVLSLVQAADQFAGSQEFLNKYGSLDNSGYVQQLYRNVLGREADPSGLADWVGQLDRGTSRGQVLVGFSESDEFKANMANAVEVLRLFYLLDQRMPTDAELQAWIGFLKGYGETDTLFSQGYPSGLPNADYVQLVFQGFLRRPADAGTLTTFGDALTAGTVTHGSLVETLMNSTEFNLDVGPVSRLYLSALLRVPDAPGLDNWVNYAKANSLQTVADQFAASQEFQNRYGAMDDTAYVTALYENILGREPDPAGLADWVGRLGSGTATRSQILIGFAQSQEAIHLFAPTVRTFLHYFTFLNTPPTRQQLDDWAAYMATLDDQLRQTFLDYF